MEIRGLLGHVADTACARDLRRKFHRLPAVLDRDIIVVFAGYAVLHALLMKRPDVVRPGEVLRVGVLRLVDRRLNKPRAEADLTRLERHALHPHVERRGAEDVRHVLGVVVASVHRVKVSLEAVQLAGTRQDVAVVHIALRAVEDDTEGPAERRRLEHGAREARPVRRDRLTAHHIRMGLEVDDADRLAALAIDAEDLHLFVGRAGGTDNVRIVRPGICRDLTVLHDIAAPERDSLRLAAAARKLRRLQVTDRVHRRIGRTRHRHVDVEVSELAELAAEAVARDIGAVVRLDRKETAVMRVRGVEDDGVAIDAGRRHDRIAHPVRNHVRKRLGVVLGDERGRLAVRERDHVDLERIQDLLREPVLVVPRHEVSQGRRDVHAREPDLQLPGDGGKRRHRRHHHHQFPHRLF